MKAWIEKGLNLKALEKSRLHWVDYLKGIAIILVVYRHILIGMSRSNDFEIPRYLWNANEIFFSFRMPLFFILSGIFLGGSLKKRTPGKLVEIKFENLFYPYLIWATIQVTLQIVLGHLHFTNADRTWRDYLYILYQPEKLDQFWYLPALFNVSVIYIFTKAILKLPGWVQLSAGVVLFFAHENIHGIDSISMLTDWMKYYIFYALGDVLSSSFFKPGFQRVMRNPWSLVAISPAFVLSQIYWLTHKVNALEFLGIAMIGCVTMFFVAFLLERMNVWNWLRVVGYHSLYIYVIHVMVAAFIRTLMVHVFHVHQVHLMLFTGIFFGVLIPILIYNYLILDGPLWFLFTYHNPHAKHKQA